MLNSDQIRWASHLVLLSDNVPGACDALDWAHNSMSVLSPSSLANMANLLDANTRSYREEEIEGFPKFASVPSLVTQLCEAWNNNRIDGDSLYWDLLAILPFPAAITRQVACITWNWCQRTTGKPINPPSRRNEASNIH